MASTQHCYIPVLGKRIRVTQMNTDGTLGANYVATDGFVTVTLTADIEAGQEIIQRNAAGQMCVNERLVSSFKRFTVETEFCGVNPSLLSFVTNANPYDDYAGDIAGFTVPEGAITGAFALELWTGLSGSLGDDTASGYFLLPLVQKGNLAALKVDGQNAVTFTLQNAYTLGGNQWGVGKYDVVMNNDPTTPIAAPLPTAIDPLDHLLLLDTAVAMPPAACDPVAVPA